MKWVSNEVSLPGSTRSRLEPQLQTKWKERYPWRNGWKWYCCAFRVIFNLELRKPTLLPLGCSTLSVFQFCCLSTIAVVPLLRFDQVIVSFMESKPKMMLKVQGYIEQAGDASEGGASLTLRSLFFRLSNRLIELEGNKSCLNRKLSMIESVALGLQSRTAPCSLQGVSSSCTCSHPRGPRSLFALHDAAQR